LERQLFGGDGSGVEPSGEVNDGSVMRVERCDEWRAVSRAQAALLIDGGRGAAAAKRWHFQWSLVVDDVVDEQQTMTTDDRRQPQRRRRRGGGGEQRVRMRQRAVVYGEALTIEHLLDIAEAGVNGGRSPRLASLLHAAACRSALMFGDALSRADCSALLRRLASTLRNSFRCAVRFLLCSPTLTHTYTHTNKRTIHNSRSFIIAWSTSMCSSNKILREKTTKNCTKNKLVAFIVVVAAAVVAVVYFHQMYFLLFLC
jgi:hypothetical protein